MNLNLSSVVRARFGATTSASVATDQFSAWWFNSGRDRQYPIDNAAAYDIARRAWMAAAADTSVDDYLVTLPAQTPAHIIATARAAWDDSIR